MATRVPGLREARAPSVGGSVGEDMVGGQVFSTSHQAYQEYTKLMSERLTEIVDREAERKRTSSLAVCTVAIGVQAQDRLEKAYPEFNIVVRPFSNPVHSEWVAQRMLANQWAAAWVQKYGTTSIHVGGFRLPYVMFGNDQVHIEVDSAAAHAVHSAHADAVDVMRIAEAPVKSKQVFGTVIPPNARARFYSGNAWAACTEGASCKHKADAVIMDLSQQFVSPAQFMCAMQTANASVGMAILPYSASMLVHSEGTLPDSSVEYAFADEHLRFKYPEGVAGEVVVPTLAWYQWLMATVRTVSGRDRRSYQFELQNVRGPFLFIQVVELPFGASLPTSITHALDLPDAGECTLVKAWKIKEIGASPFRRSSWEEVHYTVPTRVVEKTYEYGMSIQANAFTRYAIRKRLSVTNDRVVVQGTNVEVHAPLDSKDMDALEIALFVRCFIDRYEMGRLSEVLRKELVRIKGFSTLSYSRRASVMMMACGSVIWDNTIGHIDHWIRGVCDAITRMLTFDSLPVEASFEPVPHFITYTNVIATWRRSAEDFLWKISAAWPGVESLNQRARGSMLAWLLSGSQPTSSAKSGSSTFDCTQGFVGTDSPVEFTGQLFSDYVDTREPGENLQDPVATTLVDAVRQANDFQEGSVNRHIMVMSDARATEDPDAVLSHDYSVDPDYLGTLNEVHEAAFPGMASQDFVYDPTSISVDDQDRSLAADYLQLPYHFGEVPPSKNVYLSKLRAYGVTKRPQVLQETLSSINARNLSAPVVARPQDMSVLVRAVWENFLDVACHEEARAQLLQYQLDSVGLQEEAYQDWLKKAKPESVKSVAKDVFDTFRAIEEMDVDQYIAMLKSDAKPPLSDKPMRQRVEPQVIVYHEKALTSLFSSVFRVLVRRLQSLLKSNFQLNLLKDLDRLKEQVRAHHQWGGEKLKYLENDFSKFDKSQGEFAFALEEFVFRQLGMDETLLKKWEEGHERCNVRSMALGISLHVRYQRKSGDATTAFGNGILNIMSVLYAYRGTDIVWALFMGDDSLICARTIVSADIAVQLLAEQFNLLAKFYVTDAPYFASNFVLIDDDRQSVNFIPDPLKRVQKWSMSVNADEPMWDERFVSAHNTLRVYMNRANYVGLNNAVLQRYSLPPGIDAGAMGDAIATAISSRDKFRSVWEDKYTVVNF